MAFKVKDCWGDIGIVKEVCNYGNTAIYINNKHLQRIKKKKLPTLKQAWRDAEKEERERQTMTELVEQFVKLSKEYFI